MAVTTPITAYQPFTAVFVAASVLYLLFLRLPFCGIYYLRPGNRPDPQWGWKAALGATTLRFFVRTVMRARWGRTFPAKPGNPQQPVMRAASKTLLSGVASSPMVKPVDVTGEWYPKPYDKATDVVASTKVILHFCGGAYVMGDYQASSFLPALEHMCPAINAKWLSVAYRLAGSAGGQPFPSQLQDAISAYSYLLNEGVPAKNIIIAGESAGGNLVIAFLRYLQESKGRVDLPAPGAALLFSPWLDLSVDPLLLEKNARLPTCIIVPQLLEWGLSEFVPDGMDGADPYISPGLHPFRSSVPIWIEASRNEVFFDNIEKFASDMRLAGTTVEYSVIDHGTHGTTWTGTLIGFDASSSVKSCIDFIKSQQSA